MTADESVNRHQPKRKKPPTHGAGGFPIGRRKDRWHGRKRTIGAMAETDSSGGWEGFRPLPGSRLDHRCGAVRALWEDGAPTR